MHHKAQLQQMLRTLLIALAPALIGAPLLFAQSKATVESIDFETMKGTIQGVDERNRLLLKVEGEEQAKLVPLDGIESVELNSQVELPSNDEAPFRLVYSDGSIFYGKIVKEENEDDRLDDRFLFKPEGLPTMTFDGYKVQRLENRKFAEADADKAPTQGVDLHPWMLYLASGDRLPCDANTFNSEHFVPWHEQLFPNADVPYAWNRVKSLVQANAAEPDPRGLLAITTTKQGHLLKGEVLSCNATKLKLRTPDAREVELALATLANIIFKNGRFVYLSDLKPKEADEYPFIREKNYDKSKHLFKFKRDRAQGGGQLQIGGRRYQKGLGVHAISKLTFSAERRYTRFLSDVGIDDSAGGLASVEFKVLVDGEERPFKLVHARDGKRVERTVKTTGTIRKGDGRMKIEVSIAGASDVQLIVLASDNGDVNDRANWANAKFVR